MERQHHAIRVVIGPKVSGVERQRLMAYWLSHPTELWGEYAKVVGKYRQRKRR